jgi:hypothetical protein
MSTNTDVVEYIEGINSMEGNAGQTGINWPDPNHGWYLGNISILPPADLPSKSIPFLGEQCEENEVCLIGKFWLSVGRRYVLHLS